jgi:WS/DGAT/MGAT family acyltransferase
MIRQLAALDAQFLALEDDRHYGHVGSVAILDPSTCPGGTLTVNDLKEKLEQRLHMIPPFTSRLAKVPFDLDWPYWVPDDHFDLGYHVREIALPRPGSMEQLAEQTARIYSRRLDRARPLWELYFVHGLEGGRVAFISKIHHAAVDGMSGGEIMTMLYDLSPEGRDVDPPGPGDGTVAPGGMEMLVNAIRGLPQAPANVAARVGKLVPHIDVLPSVMGLPGSEQMSRNLSRIRARLGGVADKAIIERPRIRPARGAYDGEVSPHRIFGIGSMPLSDVKRVKSHLGVTVNDVVCAIVAGALRDHLERHNQLPDKPLVAQIPVSVRTEEERGTFGNQVSVMFVPIATHIDDPVERVRETSKHLRSAKDRHGALPAKALRDATQFIPPALHARATRVMMSVRGNLGFNLPYNVVISNVPGPPMDIYSCGARLEALYPLSIVTDGSLVNVTVMSYRDSIDIGITADRFATPDVQTIVEGMQRELEQLVAVADATTPAAQPS